MNQQAYPESELEPEVQAVPPRVLIVDDDEDQAFCLSTRLDNLGYDASVAYTGRSALTLAHADRPDVVILDLRLPDINGFDVCQALADDSHTCDIPIIILSGMDRHDVVRSCRAAGCRFYIHKPYDPNVLLTLLREALESEW